MSLQEGPRKKRLKTGITRVRTGCYTCRQRKVKCDEGKPGCQTCGQLGLCCEGYAPRYKFADPKTFETIQWATTVLPETGSPPQQPPSPTLLRDAGQSACSASSGSAVGSDNAIYFPVASILGTMEHNKSALIGESSSSAPQVQLDANVPAQFSPFNDVFLDTFDNSGFVHHSESNFAVQRSGRSPSRMNLFPTHLATPSECADSLQIPAHRSRKSCYIPQKEHQYQSLQYYNKGIQGIGKSFEVTQSNPLHVLAALLLSYYFELDSGSFTGGIGHMTVIDKFLAANHEEIKTNPTGQKLLCTWMNLRSQFVNRYLGGYRSSELAHTIDTFPLNRMIENGGSHHDSIMIMMCDCKLLSRKIILDWCVARGDYYGPNNKAPLDHVLTQMSLPKSRQESVSQLDSIDESYRDSLAKQRTRLDKWHSDLDLSELPIDSYVSQHKDLLRQSTTELDILPLKFHSFEIAMNYAYYAHAQMLCSEDVVDRLEQTFVEPAFTRRDYPWAELILRITHGLDISDCIYKSTFNTGILTILTACMAVCPRADVASWIENWIRKVEDYGIPLESGLPFGIIKRVIRFILDQRKKRRHVLLIMPLDIEDAEKSDLYQSDFKMQVIACGKNMDTGKLYNEMAEIPEM
ncbi:uncharacterized protein TRUGW13939_10387 [Talaromyces rugulosus]|uniref:Zn(2)-C6 fungal-type domain-containing protein n=1 Tax=Talaromyces rugulosus TaxID=121627 RepID=A0A7H8RB37_TALRU|nr:uncharacterized protein TRUGW13939_10387 [Talaromyces rugulosus]QKX63218.1 hypothetical protein TRUGW13939_10387 [Talaromyces rugulosus]